MHSGVGSQLESAMDMMRLNGQGDHAAFQPSLASIDTGFWRPWGNSCGLPGSTPSVGMPSSQNHGQLSSVQSLQLHRELLTHGSRNASTHGNGAAWKLPPKALGGTDIHASNQPSNQELKSAVRHHRDAASALVPGSRGPTRDARRTEQQAAHTNGQQNESGDKVHNVRLGCGSASRYASQLSELGRLLGEESPPRERPRDEHSRGAFAPQDPAHANYQAVIVQKAERQMQQALAAREGGATVQAALPALSTNPDGSYAKLPVFSEAWLEARGKIRVLLEYQAISDEDLRGFKEDASLQGYTRHNEITVTKGEYGRFAPGFFLRRRGPSRRQHLAGVQWRDHLRDRRGLPLEEVRLFVTDHVELLATEEDGGHGNSHEADQLIGPAQRRLYTSLSRDAGSVGPWAVGSWDPLVDAAQETSPGGRMLLVGGAPGGAPGSGLLASTTAASGTGGSHVWLREVLQQRAADGSFATPYHRLRRVGADQDSPMLSASRLDLSPLLSSPAAHSAALSSTPTTAGSERPIALHAAISHESPAPSRPPSSGNGDGGGLARADQVAPRTGLFTSALLYSPVRSPDTPRLPTFASSIPLLAFESAAQRPGTSWTGALAEGDGAR